jgi:hypothetical protein
LGATKYPLKKCKRKYYELESEDENCGILYEESDQLNENNFEESDRFPEVGDFVLIRFHINKNKKSVFMSEKFWNPRIMMGTSKFLS